MCISFRKPFQVVCSQTSSRRVQEIVTKSGIDSPIFSAHSTRIAATLSAMRQGANLGQKF